ncbi:TrkA family potassium uptake protein [Lusitaniella coriacea LEGE 07157]|uniref:Trk system potassium uptake protein TrkA n=1 Tax=Lusitaniella coriacea LEGE 07157 TaxID=945747 RepID=A0A8J7E0R7_9CYAN|nr:TrkA family potassium uptake protein [Lusitaniella coriacea]MBE9119018.1 TrkA family potassium uptake protein [Lusitaniella coriacea LEGE 07157]
MRIIAIGGGKLTYFLAKQFTSKGYNVTVVNRDATEATALARKLKATAIVGDGSSLKTLQDAGAYQADVVLGLTPYDQDNLIACQIAQQHYGVARTIALVNDPENREVFERLGVSVAFSATEIIANLIEQQAGFEEVRNVLPVADGKANVTELVLGEDTFAVGKQLETLDLPVGTLIACILRDEALLVPDGSTQLRSRDRLILVAQPEYYGQLVRSLTGEQ